MSSWENREYLENFLNCFHFIYPNLNDTFYYACADTEKMYLDGKEENNQSMLVKVYDEFGQSGIMAYVEKMGIEHKNPPLKQLQDQNYMDAKNYLKNWQYEVD